MDESSAMFAKCLIGICMLTALLFTGIEAHSPRVVPPSLLGASQQQIDSSPQLRYLPPPRPVYLPPPPGYLPPNKEFVPLRQNRPSLQRGSSAHQHNVGKPASSVASSLSPETSKSLAVAGFDAPARDDSLVALLLNTDQASSQRRPLHHQQQQVDQNDRLKHGQNLTINRQQSSTATTSQQTTGGSQILRADDGKYHPHSEGRYTPDHSSDYRADLSGKYKLDESGKYVQDSSGSYKGDFPETPGSGEFDFGYTVKDKKSGTDVAVHESDHGGVYRVLLPDHRYQIVRYYIDDKGVYRTRVHYEPSD